MSKTLVVGGAGYIGSHMVLHLLQQKEEVIVLDNLSTGSKKAVLDGTFYEGDLADRKLLRKIFKEHAIDAVMHFAAFIQVGESVTDPYKYYENNVANTLVLLDEMIKANIKNFIFSSTAATYGEPHYCPIDIQHPQNPINPYGHSKLMVEQILKDFDTAYGLCSTILRYFNAAGAEGEKIGFHEPITHLIPQMLKAASGRKPNVSIYGTDYNTQDGTCYRDYIHVMDLASAHLLALKHMKKTGQSAIYNLGNGQGFSVKEVVNAVKKVTGKDFEVIETPKRAGDPAQLIADSQLAKDTLNWQPQYSILEKIITDAWAWELNDSWHV
jgi:UDP-glucose 4-epimerase